MKDNSNGTISRHKLQASIACYNILVTSLKNVLLFNGNNYIKSPHERSPEWLSTMEKLLES